MTTRERIVEIARAEVGLSDPAKYWREVLPSTWVGPYPRHWCGAFALYCLRMAGACDWHWQVGKGFLFRLPRTTTPQPADQGYVDQPFQHHFVVTEADRHTIGSVDGNQGTPGVQVRSRAVGKHAYYSIASLLGEKRDTEPPKPQRPTLRLRATGEHVRYLQTKLAPLFAGLVVDGNFGPQTAATVMGFQRRAGLDADGVCGKLTWEALEKT